MGDGPRRRTLRTQVTDRAVKEVEDFLGMPGWFRDSIDEIGKVGCHREIGIVQALSGERLEQRNLA